jgi:hypothetical protein
MRMRACRHDNGKEKLTPCQFSQTHLTSKMLCYINSMYSTVSEMSVFKEEERLQVKKVDDRVTQPRRDHEVMRSQLCSSLLISSKLTYLTPKPIHPMLINRYVVSAGEMPTDTSDTEADKPLHAAALQVSIS